MKNSKLRWRGNGLIGIGFVFLAWALALSAWPRSYGAAVRLKVENESIAVLSGKVQSRDVLDAAIRNLTLAQKWAEPGGAPLDMSAAYSKLKRRVAVRQAPNSSLIEIEVRSRDPNEAATIANAIADAYQTQELAPRRLSGGLEAQWVKLNQRTKLREAEIQTQPNEVRKRELESLKKELEDLTLQIIREQVDQGIARHAIVEVIDSATPPLRPAFPSTRLLVGNWLLALATIAAGLLLRQS